MSDRPGLYLVNTTKWGIHHPNSLLAPLSGIRSWLNDLIINKAKELATDMGVSEFAIVHVTYAPRKRVVLYTHEN